VRVHHGAELFQVTQPHSLRQIQIGLERGALPGASLRQILLLRNLPKQQPHHGDPLHQLDRETLGQRRRLAVRLREAFLGVSVQVDPFESKDFEPGDHISGSRVGSPGALSSATGQLNATAVRPHLGFRILEMNGADAAQVIQVAALLLVRAAGRELCLGVVVQVEFERAGFETRISHFRLKGWVTKPGAFKLRIN
jgi:hypothetical protein